MDQTKPSATFLGGNVDGRDRIIQAAFDLFAREGYNGVSISQVAQAAGLVKSSIYHHFASKEALYLAVLGETCQASRVEMELGAQGETWQQRLEGAVQVLSRLVGPHSHVLSLILSQMTQPPAHTDPEMLAAVRDVRREFVAPLAREIAQGLAAGDLRPLDPELAGICLIGVIAAALQSHPHRPADERIEFALQLFLRGALAPHS